MNRFTIAVNDETLIMIEKIMEQQGSNRTAVVQMLINFGILYCREKNILPVEK